MAAVMREQETRREAVGMEARAQRWIEEHPEALARRIGAEVARNPQSLVLRAADGRVVAFELVAFVHAPEVEDLPATHLLMRRAHQQTRGVRDRVVDFWVTTSVSGGAAALIRASRDLGMLWNAYRLPAIRLHGLSAYSAPRSFPLKQGVLNASHPNETELQLLRRLVLDHEAGADPVINGLHEPLGGRIARFIPGGHRFVGGRWVIVMDYATLPPVAALPADLMTEAEDDLPPVAGGSVDADGDAGAASTRDEGFRRRFDPEEAQRVRIPRRGARAKQYAEGLIQGARIPPRPTLQVRVSVAVREQELVLTLTTNEGQRIERSIALDRPQALEPLQEVRLEIRQALRQMHAQIGLGVIFPGDPDSDLPPLRGGAVDGESADDTILSHRREWGRWLTEYAVLGAAAAAVGTLIGILFVAAPLLAFASLTAITMLSTFLTDDRTRLLGGMALEGGRALVRALHRQWPLTLVTAGVVAVDQISKALVAGPFVEEVEPILHTTDWNLPRALAALVIAPVVLFGAMQDAPIRSRRVAKVAAALFAGTGFAHGPELLWRDGAVDWINVGVGTANLADLAAFTAILGIIWVMIDNLHASARRLTRVSMSFVHLLGYLVVAYVVSWGLQQVDGSRAIPLAPAAEERAAFRLPEGPLTAEFLESEVRTWDHMATLLGQRRQETAAAFAAHPEAAVRILRQLGHEPQHPLRSQLLWLLDQVGAEDPAAVRRIAEDLDPSTLTGAWAVDYELSFNTLLPDFDPRADHTQELSEMRVAEQVVLETWLAQEGAGAALVLSGLEEHLDSNSEHVWLAREQVMAFVT
ncbi:MAG: hypothetical protein Q8S13_01710, partial [Dehalococcoidia bacterium]|nr:hypothetical protein [Dehalococcoidia bacterium]